MLEHDGAEALVRQGQEAGFLTTEEISLALDEMGLEPSDIDEFYDTLEELQIEVVDDKADLPQPEVDLDYGVKEVSTDSLQLFLKDIGKVPLLTAAQEVELPSASSEATTRQAADGGCESPARRLDREELPQPGLAVSRPDPGGDDRPRAGGGEVRLPAWLQVLDLRDVVDPPGRCPRAGRQGPDDPHACSRGREAEQDREDRAQAARRARTRPDVGSSSHASSTLDVEEIEQIRRSAQTPVSLEKPVGDEEESEFGHFIADQFDAAARRGRRDHDPAGDAASGAGDAGLPRAARARDALRPRRRAARARSTRSAARSTSPGSASARSSIRACASSRRSPRHRSSAASPDRVRPARSRGWRSALVDCPA